MADITGKGMSQGDVALAFEELIALITELRTDVGTIATFQAALTAKLDADGGITDTDYASSLVEVVAPTAPAPTITADADGA